MELSQMPLRGKDYWIVAVASMEQLMGGALSTVISVMLPMLQLTLHPELPSWLQGIIGAMGLIGIGIGSYIIGKISDRNGYLFSFRLCPIIIMAGSLVCVFIPNVPGLIIGLLVMGVGVGGGYSLDSSYISELLPERWRGFMVGVAKATSSIGFVGAAVICVVILRLRPDVEIWNKIALVMFALGLITLLMRLRWWGSPMWLLAHGKASQAAAAAKAFMGPEAEPDPIEGDANDNAKESFSLRKNLDKVIFSGIPWACEGLAVYGFSVFLPVLIMALGLEHAHGEGISKIIGSVDVSAIVNFFMLPGFIIGLVFVRKSNNVRMMARGFMGACAGLLLLLCAYVFKWGDVIMILGFVIFEVALNAGPHLLTYIIPSKIYPVSDRAEGSGIAALMGKVGAVMGVVLMPILLDLGGVPLLLGVSAGVMLLGSLISVIYGHKLGLLNKSKN